MSSLQTGASVTVAPCKNSLSALQLFFLDVSLVSPTVTPEVTDDAGSGTWTLQGEKTQKVCNKRSDELADLHLTKGRSRASYTSRAQQRHVVSGYHSPHTTQRDFHHHRKGYWVRHLEGRLTGCSWRLKRACMAFLRAQARNRWQRLSNTVWPVKLKMKCLWPQVLLKSHTDSFTDCLQNETEELVQNLYGLGLERGLGANSTCWSFRGHRFESRPWHDG